MSTSATPPAPPTVVILPDILTSYSDPEDDKPIPDLKSPTNISREMWDSPDHPGYRVYVLGQNQPIGAVRLNVSKDMRVWRYRTITGQCLTNYVSPDAAITALITRYMSAQSTSD